MSRYVPITIAEMRAFLKSEKGWGEVLRDGESIFEYEIPSCPGIVVRVFSSINPVKGPPARLVKTQSAFAR